MIAERIKILRQNHNLTQTDVAKKLGITRSSVNAWEMGISVPSTQYIVELAQLFNVSSDYLLGISKTSTINVNGLSEEEIASIYGVIKCFKKSKLEDRY